jgi:anaerobic magnesium-protoporphyrin IX monomethyl ester cyclase
MSRVLLLAPSPTENDNTFIPYAILFLRSALERRGHEVSIVDFQIGAEAYSLFRAELMKQPDVLGVSLFCGPAVSLAKKASRLCRKLSPKTCIVWGGILPTISPEMVLQEPSVDYVIRFEAEVSFPMFVEALERGSGLDAVPNLAYRKGTEIVIPPPPTEWADLSDFPPISFAGMTSRKYVITGFHFGKRVLPIYTSRGCPYNCTFCYNLLYSQRKWRPFPVEWTLDTVDKLVETFDADGIMALDDNFCVDRDRVRAIFNGVRARGHRLNWWVELRVDQIQEMSIDELREFGKLGMALTYVGVESGCNRILKLFNKRITKDDIRQANRMLAQAGISAVYTFIVGAPTETESETLETVDLAMELLRDNPLATLWQFNQFTPYPGTPLYRMAIKHGFHTYETLEDWNVGWTWRDKNLSSTTLPDSSMETLRYAALFQKPDVLLKNHSLLFKMAYKPLRAVFAERLRRHIFTPFVDTWAVAGLYWGTETLNRILLSVSNRTRTLE